MFFMKQISFLSNLDTLLLLFERSINCFSYVESQSANFCIVLSLPTPLFFERGRKKEKTITLSYRRWHIAMNSYLITESLYCEVIFILRDIFLRFFSRYIVNGVNSSLTPFCYFLQLFEIKQVNKAKNNLMFKICWFVKVFFNFFIIFLNKNKFKVLKDALSFV